MKINNILFDLDGTLTDPKVGITKSAAYALSRFGINKDPDELLHVIGPPLAFSFKKYGFSDADCDLLIKYYREYFSVTGKFENELYKYTFKMLDHLKASGKKLYIATSKPEVFAIDIAKHFGFFDYFEKIHGIALGEERIEKDVVIKRLLLEHNLSPDECLMVGDRCFDIYGAHRCGVKAVGVLFGYGSEQEHIEANADYIVDTNRDLYEFMKGL